MLLICLLGHGDMTKDQYERLVRVNERLLKLRMCLEEFTKEDIERDVITYVGHKQEDLDDILSADLSQKIKAYSIELIKLDILRTETAFDEM